MATAAEVARADAVDLDVLAPLQHEQVADLERLASIAHEKLGVTGYRALMHAKDAELAHERIHDDLEHVRQDVLFRIGFGMELLRRRAFSLGEQGWIAFGRIRQQAVEYLQNLRDPRPAARRDEANRDQMTFAQRLFERRVQLIRFDLALLEVDRHQLLVDFDNLVDQGAMRRLDRGKIGLAGRIEKAVDDTLATFRRQIDRQALAAESRLNRRQQRRQIDILGIDLVDDDQSAQLALGRPFHHPRRDHLDARLGVDDHRSGFDSVQRADGLADEIRKPGSVDQVYPGALDLEMHQ